MRTTTWRTITIALLAGLIMVTAAVAGVRYVGGGDRLLPDPPAETVSLLPIDDCEAMRDYVSEVILETIVAAKYFGQWWWRGPWDELGGGPSDYTNTNVQEEGVDELDIVKTDGEYIYLVQDEEFLIVDSWPVESAELISRTALEANANGIFLYGDQVLVVSTKWQTAGEFPRTWVATKVDLLDVTDRTAPQLIRTMDVEGSWVGARMIDGRVYLVINTYMDIPQEAWDLAWREDLGLPEVEWDASDAEREAAAEQARTILGPLVDDVVSRLQTEDLVPLVLHRAPGSESIIEPLLDCSELYRPSVLSTYSVLSVMQLDLGSRASAGGEIEAVGILADGTTVYASPRTLYVAQGSWWWLGSSARSGMSTAIHAFALGGQDDVSLRYAASGAVHGWLHSQFSMSEYDGHLRVATTRFDWWWGSTGESDEQGSLLSVLEDDGAGTLVEVGRVDRIAPGERIFAARMMGERGYLVTFEQVDPLFTLDLSDHTDPVIIGELKIPGFSAYLHPVGEDHLLAVGMDGNDDGTINGLAVTVFDLSAFDAPTVLHQHVIEGEEGVWSYSEALADHHAFTFHREVLSIPAYITGGGELFSGLIVLDVGTDRGISELGRVDHRDLPERPDSSDDWYVAVRRSVYIEDNLFSLSSRGLKVNDLSNPEVLLTTVPFF